MYVKFTTIEGEESEVIESKGITSMSLFEHKNDKKLNGAYVDSEG